MGQSLAQRKGTGKTHACDGDVVSVDCKTGDPFVQRDERGILRHEFLALDLVGNGESRCIVAEDENIPGFVRGYKMLVCIMYPAMVSVTVDLCKVAEWRRAWRRVYTGLRSVVMEFGNRRERHFPSGPSGSLPTRRRREL